MVVSLNGKKTLGILSARDMSEAITQRNNAFVRRASRKKAEATRMLRGEGSVVVQEVPAMGTGSGSTRVNLGTIVDRRHSSGRNQVDFGGRCIIAASRWRRLL